jgi:hypothetical protein
VHPTFLFKVFLTMSSPFLQSAFYSKLVYIDSLKQLFTKFSMQALRLDDEIFRYVKEKERKERDLLFFFSSSF